MTVLVTPISGTVQTLEQRIAHDSLILFELYKKRTVVEGDGPSVRAVTWQMIPVYNDNSARFVTRISLPVDPAYNSRSVRQWQNVLPLDDLAIPAQFFATPS